MAAKFKLKGVPRGTGFHSFRHAYKALMVKVGSAKAVQQELMRHGDPRMTEHYGRSAQPVLEQARITHTCVTELAIGNGIN